MSPVCDIITVDLKNVVEQFYGNISGTYKLSDSINGKPSWKSKKQAIWWIPKGNNGKKDNSEWAIGPSRWIGVSSSSALEGSPSDKDFISWPYDQKYTVWKYWDKTDSSYIIPGANDIEVQCKRKGNTYLDSKIVKFLILM